MYYYLFEAQRGPKEYERAAQIKELLANLGIAGEMATPTPGRSVEDLVASAISKRYSTVIAVGGIELVNRVAHALEPHDAVFGIIPTQEHPDITALIGVSDWKSAAEQLKRRRWRPVRMGSMNGGQFFILPARIEIPEDAAFTLSAKPFSLSGVGQEISVVAADTLEVRVGAAPARKQGFLRSLFGKTEAETGESHFSLDSFEITCEREAPVKVAGTTVAMTPVKFGLQEKELKLIVGKGATEQ